MKQSYDYSKIEWLEVTDSTNLEIRRRLDVLDNLSVIAARLQTSGRGQGTHIWLSPGGENLTFSVLLRFGGTGLAALPVADALFITRIATLAVHDFLEEEGVESRIKWPNDIWAGSCKICGMLIENILNGSEVACSVVGIGLNINQKSFDPSLPNPVSLSQLTGRDYDIEDALRRLYKAICRRVAMLGTPDGRNELESGFNKYVFHLEEPIRPQPDRQP